MICLLCNSSLVREYNDCDGIKYYQCDICALVFKHPDYFPSKELEKERYLLHNNNVDDQHYQEFVAPIVEVILLRIPTSSNGLDFGAGTGPVITKLLEDQGYSVKLYDPFFYMDKSVLSLEYDFIVCCEVAEHFHQPMKEFKLLRKMLNPGGLLVCMTVLLPEKKEFKKWYYKNDPTHVVFYSEQSLQWIKNHLSFAEITIKDRLIVFET